MRVVGFDINLAIEDAYVQQYSALGDSVRIL